MDFDIRKIQVDFIFMYPICNSIKFIPISRIIVYGIRSFNFLFLACKKENLEIYSMAGTGFTEADISKPFSTASVCLYSINGKAPAIVNIGLSGIGC